MLLVKPISEKAAWESFLSEVKPHTFLQSWSWGTFNERTNHAIWRLGIFDGDTLVAVALALKVTARRGAFIFVPHGPIIKNATLSSAVIKAVTNYVIPIARKEGCAFIRISPLLPQTESNNEIFAKLGYRDAPIHMMHPELAWILDISKSETELLAGMRKTTRYSVKKAEKDGVTVTMSRNPEDLSTFNAIYDETVRRQDFKAFPREYFETELRVFMEEDRALLFFAHYQGTVIGTAFIVFDDSSAYYHHGATTRTFPSLTDAQLLQWEVIKEAKRRGLSYYNFWGVVPEDKKRHPWHGLSIFKRGFGGFSEAYVHAKDLPLSSRYWLTVIIETLRRIKRRL